MKLKKIITEMAKMPNTLGGFNDTPKLTAEQKQKLMEMVRNYNQLGLKLRMENSLIETASALSEISELAETYACNEAADWFATEVVKTDFKRARNITETFQKLARECHGKVQQLNALYEDMGHILGRYYEIADPMQEVAPNPANIAGQRGLPAQNPQSVMEVKPNDKNIKSQRQLPANGPLKEIAVDDKHANIKGQRELPHTNGPATPQVKETTQSHPPMQTCKKCKRPISRGLSIELCPICAQNKSVNMQEVHPNDKNIKSQRQLPSGGPAPAQVKEIAVDSMNANIKSQRNLPSGGPTSYNPPKDPKDTGSIKEVSPPGFDKRHPDIVKKLSNQYGDKNPAKYATMWKLANKGLEDESLNEVKPNEDNLQSQRELPQSGPESYTPPKLENPSVPVNPAGSGECNVKGERDVPQGGPSKDVVYKGQNESLSLSEILKTVKK